MCLKGTGQYVITSTECTWFIQANHVSPAQWRFCRWNHVYSLNCMSFFGAWWNSSQVLIILSQETLAHRLAAGRPNKTKQLFDWELTRLGHLAFSTISLKGFETTYSFLNSNYLRCAYGEITLWYSITLERYRLEQLRLSPVSRKEIAQ